MCCFDLGTMCIRHFFELFSYHDNIVDHIIFAHVILPISVKSVFAKELGHNRVHCYPREFVALLVWESAGWLFAWQNYLWGVLLGRRVGMLRRCPVLKWWFSQTVILRLIIMYKELLVASKVTARSSPPSFLFTWSMSLSSDDNDSPVVLNSRSLVVTGLISAHDRNFSCSVK